MFRARRASSAFRASAVRLALALPVSTIATPLGANAQEPGQVTVYRDPWGVPHVYAARETDGFYGLGYAQAEDRLDVVLRIYLATMGRLAAAFGPDFVDADADQLLFRHLEEARLGMKQVPRELADAYRAFVAGIERYMADHPERVPDWAPALEPALPMAWFRSFLWRRLLFDATVYWLREAPRDGKCSRPLRGGSVVPQADAEAALAIGSNEWVLMPWRTRDGAVIHLGDPHGGLNAAWEFRIDAGGIKAAASGFPGFALPFIGHTRHVAWAFTLFGTDGYDCYTVVTDASNPRRYRYDGAWQTMVTKRVTIPVKNARAVTRTFEYTRHNGVLSPVVRRSGDTAFVLSIPDMHAPGHFDRQFWAAAHARSMAEFKRAIAPGFISANVMAGSSDGHTFYVRGGYVPRRPPGFDFARPVPGNTSATAWLGMHPLEEHITLEDPATGYMSNNNISPDRMIPHGAPDLSRFPAYLYDDRPGRTTSRGIRAIEVLSRAYDATVADALELALDDKWVGVERWQAVLLDGANAAAERLRTASPALRTVVDRLVRFDGHARKESKEALTFYYWWTSMMRDTARFRALREGIERGSPPAGAGETLLAAADSARLALEKRHGTIDVRLGDEFRAGRGDVSHPSGSGGLPGLGFFDGIAPLRAISYSRIDSANHRWTVGGGYHTTLTIFTDPIKSFTLAPLGQSGDPKSPHYSDQAVFISERRLRPSLFYRADLVKTRPDSTMLRVTGVARKR